jgi:predicted HTH domain antitoxin
MIGLPEREEMRVELKERIQNMDYSTEETLPLQQ